MRTTGCVAMILCTAAAACTVKVGKPSDPLAAPGTPLRPALAPVKPVTEMLWGQQVTDNYRYMEAMDPATVEWIKLQGTYTRSMLSAIPQRGALEARIAAFSASFGLARGFVHYGGRAVYEERAPASDGFDLVASDSGGKRKIIDLETLRAANGGAPFAIEYFVVSPDGSRVAAALSQGGSESASVFVFDVATGQRMAGPLDRADPGFAAWSPDSRRLYVTRLKPPVAGEEAAEKYRNTTVDSWDLKSEPMKFLGSGTGRAPALSPDETPVLRLWPTASVAVLASLNGTQNELALWTAPVSGLDDQKLKWQALVERTDDITAVEVSGDTVYLLSHKHAPTFEVLRLKAGQSLSQAQVLVPAQESRVIESMHVASDALYVIARQRAYSVLLRISHTTGRVEEVALPFKGLVREAFADARQPGITIQLQNFVVPPRTFAYDPASQRFTNLKLGVTPRYDASRYAVHDLDAKGHDGVAVPETLIRRKDADGPQVVVIQAYGAYGISQLANFSFRSVSFLEAGGAYAYCHVRGGGELGEAWRLAGKDANKPNSWRDLISCAEDLIARGHTTPDKLFVFSGSAGGITLGRALTERPDLFAGVIAVAPGVNTLRQEFQPVGPLNIPEFGTIETENGFRNLLAMDTIQHVHAGVQYPALLITTGLNDPRVLPWEPAKFTAALQASGSMRPILLRIDEEAGHGFANTKSQDDALHADMWSFVFWRAGFPEWRPRFSK